MDNLAAYIGIAWSDQKHDIYLIEVRQTAKNALSSTIRRKPLRRDTKLARRARLNCVVRHCFPVSRMPLIFS
jgi:hypothetical protein